MDTEKPDMKKDITYFAVLIICLVTIRNGCAGSSAQTNPDLVYQPSQAATELKLFQDRRAEIVNSHLTPEAKKEIEEYGKLLRRAWIK